MQSYFSLNRKTEKLSTPILEVDQLSKAANQSLHFIASKIRDMPTQRNTKDIWSSVASQKEKLNYDL